MASRKKPVGGGVRELVEKTDDEDYALVLKAVGGSRFKLKAFSTQKEIIGKIRGTLRRKGAKSKNRVEPEHIVLISYRDFQDEIVDIIYVYDNNEERNLRKSGISFEDEKVNNIGDDVEFTEDAFEFDEI